MNYIVETKNLKKYYQMGDATVKALDGIDFCVKDQEFIAIIGKSGSGKSTLLHMLGGLDTPTEGEVLIEGKSILKLKKEQLAIFRRRKIGFIFQNYNLVPDLNVYESFCGYRRRKICFREHYLVGNSKELRSQGLLQQSQLLF